MAFRIYKEIETFLQTRIDPDVGSTSFPTWHGQRGPIHTSQVTNVDHLSPLFISSALNSGLPRTYDFNNPNNGRYGVGYFDFNIFRGTRDSAAKVFMSAILKFKPLNFHLKLESQVHKVIIEKISGIGNDKKSILGTQQDVNVAVGIIYEERKSKLIRKAYLKRSCVSGISDCIQPREVILSAGSLMTPNILLNTGIGPEVMLKNSDVKVKIRSKYVGKNLQDHPAVGFIASLRSSLIASYPTAYSMAEQWAQYILAINDTPKESENGAWGNFSADYGLLGSAGISAGAFLRSPYTLRAPDIQLTLFPTVSEPHLVNVLRANNITKNITVGGTHQMLITIALLNPDARHDIVLDSSNCFRSVPKIILSSNNQEYLTDLDLAKLEWAVNRVREITSTEPISNVILEEVSPGNGMLGLSKYY